jgi:ankyrin repeat protein
VRSVGYGLLLLSASMLPAAGQTRAVEALPTVDEARNAARCDGTQWAKPIAAITAADPERDAQKQIAEGNFSLRSARALDTVLGRVGLVLRPGPIQEAPTAPDAASKPSETGTFQADVTRMQPPGDVLQFLARTQTPGVRCLEDARPLEAFPLPVYMEDATPDDLNKWCARAATVLADDYARRFNGHVVRDPTYPHKDACALVEGGLSVEAATGRITLQSRPDWTPAPIPDKAAATSPDEPRDACDATPSAKIIAEIKASEPEQDAEQQLARGNISLKWIKVRRRSLFVRTQDESQAFDVVETLAELPGLGLKKELVDLRKKPGVVCHPNIPVGEAFPVVDNVEDETDALNKRCVRAVLALADDYLGRFNQRVVGHPAYPHKDLCWGAGDTNTRRGIAYRPSADLIPASIPDVATAARFGLADRVAQFIADGADIGQTDIFGFDALMWAVVRDYRPIIDLLIAVGGKPDFCAALEAAVALARVEAIAAVAGRCASPERRLRFLIQAMNSSGDRRDSPSLFYIIDGSELVMRALLHSEPAPSLSGSTEIASALLQSTRLDLARLLLDRAAAEPNRVSEWWDGLLGKAIARRREGLLELLLERGARPGPGAVFQAVAHKSPNMVRILARHGAGPDRGRPELLQRSAQTEVVHDPLGRRYLPSPPADADPPIFTALHPLMDFKMVDLLLELGAYPNVRDVSGRTPLMIAITHSRIYGKKGGAPWIEPFVPQHLLEGQEDWAHRGVEPVRALLAKGADVGLADRNGLTALHHAARSDYNVEIAEILLRHGADIEVRDTSGRTPLDHARAAKLTRMLELLEAAAHGRSR